MSDVTLKVNEPTFAEVFNKIWPGFKASPSLTKGGEEGDAAR